MVVRFEEGSGAELTFLDERAEDRHAPRLDPAADSLLLPDPERGLQLLGFPRGGGRGQLGLELGREEGLDVDVLQRRRTERRRDDRLAARGGDGPDIQSLTTKTFDCF